MCDVRKIYLFLISQCSILNQMGKSNTISFVLISPTRILKILQQEANVGSEKAQCLQLYNVQSFHFFPPEAESSKFLLLKILLQATYKINGIFHPGVQYFQEYTFSPTSNICLWKVNLTVILVFFHGSSSP